MNGSKLPVISRPKSVPSSQPSDNRVQTEELDCDSLKQDFFLFFRSRHAACLTYMQSTCLFNLHAEYIMRNAGLDEPQAGIKIAGRNINNLRYTDDTTLMAESAKLKSLLMKVKRRVKKLA